MPQHKYCTNCGALLQSEDLTPSPAYHPMTGEKMPPYKRYYCPNRYTTCAGVKHWSSPSSIINVMGGS